MYATRNHILAIYGQKFLDSITPRDVADPMAAIDAALDDASAEIDGYLSVRYDLPLANLPKVLRRPCIDIAAYVIANAHTRLTKTMEDRYSQAIEFLEKISKGAAGLGRDEPSSAVEGSENGTRSGADFTAQPRKFGRGRS